MIFSSESYEMLIFQSAQCDGTIRILVQVALLADKQSYTSLQAPRENKDTKYIQMLQRLLFHV